MTTWAGIVYRARSRCQHPPTQEPEGRPAVAAPFDQL